MPWSDFTRERIAQEQVSDPAIPLSLLDLLNERVVRADVQCGFSAIVC
jgi:hypothetical protein